MAPHGSNPHSTHAEHSMASDQEFADKFKVLLRSIADAGLHEVYETKLHGRHTFDVVQNKEFNLTSQVNRRAKMDFALRVGTYQGGTVWAAADGRVYIETKTEVSIPSTPVTLDDSIAWPAQSRMNFKYPLEPTDLALVRLDIVHWAAQKLPIPSIENIVFPDTEILKNALKQYPLDARPEKISPMLMPQLSAAVQSHGVSSDQATEQLASVDTLPSGQNAVPSAHLPIQKQSRDPPSLGEHDHGIFSNTPATGTPPIVSSPRSVEEPEHITSPGICPETNSGENATPGENQLSPRVQVSHLDVSSQASMEECRQDFGDREHRLPPQYHCGPSHCTIARLTLCLGPVAMSFLPDIDSFWLSDLNDDEYLNIRIRLGECWRKKPGPKYELWGFLKLCPWTIYAPPIDFVRVVPAPTGKQRQPAMHPVKYGGSIASDQLVGQIKEELVKLRPEFKVVQNSHDTIQALIKYAIILGVEKGRTLLTDHRIPINPCFEKNLQEVCRKFELDEGKYKKPPQAATEHDVTNDTADTVANADEANESKLSGVDKLLKGVRILHNPTAASSHRQGSNRMPAEGSGRRMNSRRDRATVTDSLAGEEKLKGSGDGHNGPVASKMPLQGSGGTQSSLSAPGAIIHPERRMMFNNNVASKSEAQSSRSILSQDIRRDGVFSSSRAESSRRLEAQHVRPGAPLNTSLVPQPEHTSVTITQEHQERRGSDPAVNFTADPGVESSFHATAKHQQHQSLPRSSLSAPQSFQALTIRPRQESESLHGEKENTASMYATGGRQRSQTPHVGPENAQSPSLATLAQEVEQPELESNQDDLYFDPRHDPPVSEAVATPEHCATASDGESSPRRKHKSKIGVRSSRSLKATGKVRNRNGRAKPQNNKVKAGRVTKSGMTAKGLNSKLLEHLKLMNRHSMQMQTAASNRAKASNRREQDLLCMVAAANRMVDEVNGDIHRAENDASEANLRLVEMNTSVQQLLAGLHVDEDVDDASGEESDLDMTDAEDMEDVESDGAAEVNEEDDSL